MMEPIKPEPIEPAGDEPQAKLHSLADLLSAIEADADRRNIARALGNKLGPVTGLTSLDKMLGGYLAPGVHIVHGDPGAGKTAFALQIAADCEFPALYVSAEMPMIELARRITARITKTFLSRLKSGEMNASQAIDLANRAFKKCRNLYLLDATAGPAPVEHIARCIRQIKQKTASDQMLVVVDSVHSWVSGTRTDEKEYDALTAGLADLRALASLMEGPVIGIAERNRANRKEAGMNASAGTRAFEYGAETVISLSEPEPKEPDPTVGEKRINAVIQKNRHDAAGVHAKLAFHGALQQFREV